MKLASGYTGATFGLAIPALLQIILFCLLDSARSQYAPEFPTQVSIDAKSRPLHSLAWPNLIGIIGPHIDQILS